MSDFFPWNWIRFDGKSYSSLRLQYCPLAKKCRTTVRCGDVCLEYGVNVDFSEEDDIKWNCQQWIYLIPSHTRWMSFNANLVVPRMRRKPWTRSQSFQRQIHRIHQTLIPSLLSHFIIAAIFIVINSDLYFQLLRMAIHQKLVLTQRLEDIEMTDLRPANVTIINIIINVIIITTILNVIMDIFRVELDVVVGKHQGTAAEAAAEDIQASRFTIVIRITMIIIILLMIIVITVIMIFLVLVN